MADVPVDQPRVLHQLLATSFDLTNLAQIRLDIAAASRQWGLPDDAVDDWVAAINELMINAIRHGAGRRVVRLHLDHTLTCEVSDQGPGFDTTRYIARPSRPPLSDTGGMGLWMVGQLATFDFIDSSPAGTTIRIAVSGR